MSPPCCHCVSSIGQRAPIWCWNWVLMVFCRDMRLIQRFVRSARRRSPSVVTFKPLKSKSVLIVSLTDPSLSTSFKVLSSIFTQAWPCSTQAITGIPGINRKFGLDWRFLNQGPLCCTGIGLWWWDLGLPRVFSCFWIRLDFWAFFWGDQSGKAYPLGSFGKRHDWKALQTSSEWLWDQLSP